MSSKDNDEERVMHPKSHNTKIMVNDEADEVIRKTFSRYQIGLETSMKGNDFVYLLYFKSQSHNINFKHCRSYMILLIG